MSFVFDSTKPIAIGSDHAGIEYKAQLVKWLTEKGYPVNDLGTYTADSVDYPDYAHAVSTAVEKEKLLLVYFFVVLLMALL